MPKINLNKVKKFILRKDSELFLKVREAYYSGLTAPRLEHVYKDRSFKSALELELKPSKCHPKELWNWKD
jgi:hypothetical protein